MHSSSSGTSGDGAAILGPPRRSASIDSVGSVGSGEGSTRNESTRVVLKSAGGVCLRLVATTLLITAICVVALVAKYEGPHQYEWSSVVFRTDVFNLTTHDIAPLDTNYSDYTVLLDGHSHTKYSDGKLTPEMNIQWHKVNGFNAAIITDHQTIEGGLEGEALAEELDDFIVIPGQEWTTCRCHLNIIGINETIMPNVTDPTDEQLKRFIAGVHRKGGIVVVNHILWSAVSLGNDPQPSRQDWADWGADYIEIVNQQTFDVESYLFARNHGLGVITGTDMHSPLSSVHGWTALKPKEFTAEAIMDELRAKRTSIVYSSQGTPSALGREVEINPMYTLLSPVLHVGEFVAGFFDYEPGMWNFAGGYCGSGEGGKRTRQHHTLTIHWTEIFLTVAYLLVVFFVVEFIKALDCCGRDGCCSNCCGSGLEICCRGGWGSSNSTLPRTQLGYANVRGVGDLQGDEDEWSL